MKTQLISATIHAGIVGLCMLHTTVDHAPPKRERPTMVLYRPPPIPPTGHFRLALHGPIEGPTPQTTAVVPIAVPPNIPPIETRVPGAPVETMDTTWTTGPS